MYKTRLWFEINMSYIKINTGDSIKIFNFLNSDAQRDFILSFIYSDSGLTLSLFRLRIPTLTLSPKFLLFHSACA